MTTNSPLCKDERKNCIICKNRKICYIFYERYYPVKDLMINKLTDDLLSNAEIEELCDIIKRTLPNRCGCYEKEVSNGK